MLPAFILERYPGIGGRTLYYLLLDHAGLRVEHEVHVSLAVHVDCLIQIDCFQREGPLLTIRRDALNLSALDPIFPRKKRRAALQDDDRR